MSKFSGGPVIATTAVIGAAVVGAALWFEYGRAPAPVDVPATAVAMEPKEDATPGEAAEASNAQPAENAPAEEAVVTPEAPSETEEPEVAEVETPAEPVADAVAPQDAPAFDEVRREEDGMTIIAGRAAPGAAVQILQDGVEIATATADGSGKFAAIAMIAPDGQGHVLSLLQTGAAGALPSDDQIILAPLAAPVVVAEADVTPEPAPQTQETAEPLAEDVAEPVAEDVAVSESTEAQTDEVAAVPEGTEPATEDVAAALEETSPTAEDAVVAAEDTTTATEETAQVADTAPVAEQSQDVATESGTVTAGVQETETAPSTPDTIKPKAQDVAEAPADAATTPDTPEPSTNEVAVLKSTAEGVELLNVPRPEVMDNVALDTISYSDVGDVQLAGRAQSDARSVQVYLNNSAVVSLAVDEQGRWRGDLPDVDEGIYTLRVDEVSEDGSVTSRVETPFKREDPEVLAEAAAAQDGPLKQITVQKGATLWAIARDRYGDGLLYVNVLKANAADIRDPDLIYPGQVFALPTE